MYGITSAICESIQEISVLPIEKLQADSTEVQSNGFNSDKRNYIFNNNNFRMSPIRFISIQIFHSNNSEKLRAARS